MLVEKLSRRAIRKDAVSTDMVKPMSEIYSITDNAQVVEESRQKWLDKFKDIFTSI